jgi:cell division protein ZapA (FtsZ GTPase activity inhibitor)
MEYQSNSSNLFKKYSNKTGSQRKKNEAQLVEPSKEIVEYKQRYKALSIDKEKANDSGKQSKVIVHIGGMQHKLSVEDHDGETYIRAVAEHADRIIDQIMQDNPGMNMMNVLILSVVNAVDEMFRSEQKGSAYDSKMEQTEYDLKSLKIEYIKQREINWELKKEVMRLKDLIQSQLEEGESFSTNKENDLLPLEEMIFTFSDSEDHDE